MNCIFLILSISRSRSHRGDLFTRDYSVYSGGGGGGGGMEGGGGGVGVRVGVVRGRGSELLAQRIPGSFNPLCVASHVSRLFVW